MDGIFCEHGVYPKTLGATVLFFIAFVREIALWTGGIDARRSVAEATLKRGESLLIVPGGEAEQIRTKYGRELVFLKKRKGFIRLAIRQGVPVIPVYAFGVADYYHTSDFLIGLRMWIMKQFQICVVLSSGMWGSPCCPILTPTTIVFGEALNFDQSDNPTAGQVDKAHAVYMEELKKLFDKHKKGLGYGDRELELV
jgi:2-acylglycerol O-acyltransferase 2